LLELGVSRGMTDQAKANEPVANGRTERLVRPGKFLYGCLPEIK
jgi:hypothetical protein